MTGTLFVVRCPLLPVWESDPLTTPEQAREALRAHLSEHAHGELVNFIANDEAWPSMLTHYDVRNGTEGTT